MPTYEYACGACGHEWELEQRISEKPATKCPKCKKSKAQRLISGGNFILKGEGWYSDLYHKPAKKKEDKSTSDSPSSSSSGESSAPAATEPKKESKKESKKKAANE
jgi:putative FmdB family regulatory protein